MFGIIKLNSDHSSIVKLLSKELKISESEVIELMIEDIQMILISFRNNEGVQKQVIDVLKNRDLSWKMSGILNKQITLNT